MTAISKRRSSTEGSRTRRRRPSVELLESRQLLSTFVVNNTNDGGPGSLRRAIVHSNGDTAQTNLITFNIATSGVQTINLLSALPAITQSVTIDGTTEPGYSGTPLVELNGAGAGSGTDGLMVEANDTTVQGLVIAQFSQDGIYVSASNDAIAANYIGTAPTGTSAIGNGRQGVLVNGSNDTIGGSTAGSGNVIAGNGNDGLQIAGSGATGDVVQGNAIGKAAVFSAGGPNGRFGILVNFQASHNLIGTNGDGVNDFSELNLISGNSSWGIEISDPGTQDNVVAGNYIGTGVHGEGTNPNGGGGVLIQDGATANLIGTDGVSAANADEVNVISGNNGAAGIMISESGTNFNVVAGNLIGTDALGANPLGNSGDGVLIQAGAQSNVIGTNGDGNGDAAERNVISGNTSQGVYIGGPGTNSNVVAGNLIGVDMTGATVMANINNGVLIADGAQSNRIGVSAGDLGAAAEPNVISGNDSSGVSISGAGTNFNTVSGNWIGNNPADSFTVSNGGDGVSIFRGAQSNTIGGSVALANSIVNNIGNGVGVYGNATTGNTIRFNLIRKNQSLGIDLGGDGGTPNHVPPATSGPNNWENYPIITSAGSGTTTTAGVSFVSLPNGTYTLDFYVSPVSDPSGYGEGNGWLGSVSVTTDANGQVNPPTTFNLPAETLPGRWITATATDQAGDTSEFSNAWHLPTLSYQVTVTPSITSPAYGQSLAFTTTVSSPPRHDGLGTPTGTIQYQVDGSPFGPAVTLVNGAATSNSTSTLSAGVHTISAAYSGDAFYTSFTQTISQTVSQAALTVTADNKSKVYGAADPILTYTPSGTLYYGDAYSVISGVTLSTTTGAAATTGTHPITATGGTAANYAITDVNGTLTITPAPLTVQQLRTTVSRGSITGIVLTFSDAVDPSRAQNIKDYTLVNAGRDGKLGTRDDVKVPLKKAVYDSVMHTITLTPSGKLASNVPCQLTALASNQATGLTDTGNRLLDGNGDGTPGGDYVGRFGPLPVVQSLKATTSRTGITGVVLTFNLPLEASRAQNLSNYALISAGPDGRWGTADDQVISLKKAVYKSSNPTVTLTPVSALPKTGAYQLTVSGTGSATGLIDVNGSLLDGNKDGIAGGSFVGRFGATAKASISAKAFDALTVGGELP
jgi:hypothetical protein